MKLVTRNDGLNALYTLLEETDALSEEFKGQILQHALNAVSIGYARGQAVEAAHSYALPDADPPVRPDAEAERIRAGMLDIEPYSP